MNGIGNKSGAELVWIAIKNRQAKDMNKQPWYFVRQYKVKERREKCVILMNGKQFPTERCFETEQECKDSIGDEWKARKWGE